MFGASRRPRVTTDLTYRGIDATVLENEHLRVLVLPGKGGDILEFRDKRTDVDVLWHANHNWQPPESRYVPSEAKTTWLDHYPGGWQMNLPIAGFGREIEGNAYGLHGESALVPWDCEVVRNDADAATVRLTTELVRYPFELERELRLPAGESTLRVTETITNLGGVDLEYIWQQHVALGRPLLDPAARLDVPAGRGVTESDDEGFKNGRIAPNREFDWPEAPTRDGGTTDLREIPPESAEIHDLTYATDLDGGWYALTNPEIDLGFGFSFPTDPFECVWFWQALGGFHESPYFNRNYNVGLEPTTAYPSDGIPDAQRENGTMKTLGAGESISAEFAATTFGGHEGVSAVAPDGSVMGLDG
ncbi:MAG: aldose 1-epimerase [Haloarculaceae archaeon]